MASVVEDRARSDALVDHSSLPAVLKYILLIIFCFAQFLDAFNNSSLFAAIPPISVDLHIVNSTSVWLISAYQLTFAALLLSSGRLSDLYDPKYVFVAGMLLMSFCALGAGFVRVEVPLIVLRALMGVGAALNIPSAMALIIRLFPNPAAHFVLAILSFVLLPSTSYSPSPSLVGQARQYSRLKRLDLIGVSLLTAALVLFIFAVTSGSIDGWGSARVIAPLVLSVFLAVIFFLWELYLPESLAAVPPSMWKYRNFTILIAVGLQPFMWWAAVQLLFSWYYQEVFEWSTINTAVHFLPLGLVSFPTMGLASVLQQKFSLKWVILCGEIIVLAGTVLFPFADSKEHYWRFAFPGFCLGTAGMTMVFATTNIALFAITPPEVAGIVGAVFTCALQLGSAAGAAIVTSIQTSVQESHGGSNGFQGRSAGFWFLFAFTAVETLGVLFFMRNTVPPVVQQMEKERQIEAVGTVS
ncbi:major facilitator superfamily [Heterobasidion irregulare TC 32-1]|uniref:Major facilitator superfamily n=1 Tax=Heterobasidion irregulare (strain TC 32-1) TaxID=747525 RepID=W4JW63_HETIT|nr:major facilitator superfamily [Heterobasidion irregulare TC 32-1]ETW77131.1 major facilitator superfamily [Heterobasidion irregulare TC 32-1]